VLVTGYYLAQTALEKISALVAVSEYARRTIVDHLGADAVLIPNGVRVDHFAGAEPLRAWPGPAVGFLGRMDEPRKGLPVLLEAFGGIVERHPGATLVLVGPGEVEDVLDGVPPGLRDSIVALGRLDEKDKARALASLDVYVAPNTGGESFGIVLLEAMSAGAPVVASDLDAFARVLDDGRCGVLFPVGDASALGRALSDLLDDGDRRARLVEAGSRRATAYDWRSVAGDLLDVYASVTAGQQGVREDLRGQIVGRLARRRSGGGPA
jgi:phosphatidylinositol alpha-mannosyltransferase